MGLRGPTPKGTRLRLLEGVPGHSRPINRQEPQPTGPPERPAFLTGPAGEEWARATAAMPPGVYTVADVAVLTVHCVAWAMYRASLAQVGREGMTAIGSMGQKVAHPALAVAAQQAALILRTADRLGMTPGARARLEATDAAGSGGKFEGLIGGYRV